LSETSAGARAPYSLGEEIANCVTHGVGAALSVAGLVLLVVFAALYGDAWHVASVAVYGTTLILLYTASTVYHACKGEKAKHVTKILDHSSIFLLIAGTYTPFTLVTLRGPWGWALFGVVWGLAVAGVVFKALFVRRLKVLSVAIYLLMGWLVVTAAGPLMRGLPKGGLALLLAGGLAYTAGTVFYALKKVPYMHSVWHLFVLAGSALHFFAVLFFVIPR
jgi:hemolysin III